MKYTLYWSESTNEKTDLNSFRFVTFLCVYLTSIISIFHSYSIHKSMVKWWWKKKEAKRDLLMPLCYRSILFLFCFLRRKIGWIPAKIFKFKLKAELWTWYFEIRLSLTLKLKINKNVSFKLLLEVCNISTYFENLKSKAPICSLVAEL